MSRFWRRAFRSLYRVLRFVDPLVRAAYRATGIGNVVDVRIRSRASGRERSLLLGVLRAGDHLYLGHPNGHAVWTRDLEAAGTAAIRLRDGALIEFRPVRLAHGRERDAVIEATDQHPFPGNLIYRLGRRHVRAAGVYYRVEPLHDGA